MEDFGIDSFQEGAVVSSSQGVAEVKEPVVTEPVVENVDAPRDEGSLKVEEDKIPVKEDAVVAKEFDITSINSRLGTDFKDEGDLKAIIDRASKSSELETKLTELEATYKDVSGKYTDVKKYFDPKKYFANDDLYKLNQIISKYGDINSNIALKIDALDLNSSSPVDMAVLGMQLNNPSFKGGDSAAREMVAKELGVDVDELNDINNLPDIAYNKLSEMANRHKEKFNDIKNIEMPEAYDVEEIKKQEQEEANKISEELKGTWKPVLTDMVKNFNEIKSYTKKEDGELELYNSYTVGEQFKKDIEGRLIDAVVNGGLKPTEATIKNVYTQLENEYKLQNFDKIVRDYAKKELSNYKGGVEKDIHNPQEVNNTEAPVVSNNDNEQNAGFVKYMTGGL